MSRPVGIPRGCRVVRAEADTIPVEFHAPPCCYATWLDEDLMRQTETRPPVRLAVPAAPALADEPAGQLAFGE